VGSLSRARRWVRAAGLGFALFVPRTEDPPWPSPTKEKAPLLSLAGLGRTALAAPAVSADRTLSPDEFSLQRQPVCVASSVHSFGKLGRSLLYVHQRVGEELRVGYFAYWSTERPWGHNTLTYTLLPALAIDAVYSHFFFVFPGIQRVLYGPADIEGVFVTYQVTPSGELVLQSGLADDDNHAPVSLNRQDLLTQDGKVALLTQVWSHQLGTKGAAGLLDSGKLAAHCFEGDALQPLTPAIAATFRLGTAERPRRARPAWRALGTGSQADLRGHAEEALPSNSAGSKPFK